MTTSARQLVDQTGEEHPGLNEQFIDEMIHRMSIKRYNPGEVIVQKGDIGREMYFISGGLVHIIIPDRDPIPLSPGAYFGEVTMYLDTERTATVVAATECDLLLLRRDVLLRVLMRWPAVQAEFLEEAERRRNDEKKGVSGTSKTSGADWMEEIARRGVGYDPSVQVVIRIRPRIGKEASAEQCVFMLDPNHVRTLDPTVPKKEIPDTEQDFKYDFVFDETSSTEEIFSIVGNHVVDAAYDSFNTCVFAYGQTGTGKTHTMTELNKLIAKEMFMRIEREEEFDPSVRYTVKLGYLEIYCERLKDLLIPQRSAGAPPPAELRIREKKGSVFVENLNRPEVKSLEDVEYLIDLGDNNRTMERTAENSMSSPGHAIVLISLRKVITTEDNNHITTDCLLNLVDLAGTARADDRQERTRRRSLQRTLADARHEAVAGHQQRDRARESSKINLSLETLSNVINKLAFGSTGHIPYRNSTLTRLLSQCFGGNCKTYMIACVGPCNLQMSLRTLRKAQSAMNIINKPIRAHPKGVVASSLTPLQTQTLVSRPPTEFPVDSLIDMIEEANQLCAKTGNGLTFSVLPHEQLSPESRFAVYVTDGMSIKSEMLAPDEFKMKLELERAFVAENWNERTMELNEETNRLLEPFWIRPPDHLIGTIAVGLDHLLELQPVSGAYELQSSDGMCDVEVVIEPVIPQGSNVSKLEDFKGTSVPLSVHIPRLTNVNTEYSAGIYVKYVFPEDDNPEHVRYTERASNEALEGTVAVLNHTTTVDFPVDAVVLDSFSHEDHPKELTIEVWGHEDEAYLTPGRLRAMLNKAYDDIARLEAELKEMDDSAKMLHLENQQLNSRIKADQDAKTLEVNRLKEKAKALILQQKQAAATESAKAAEFHDQAAKTSAALKFQSAVTAAYREERDKAQEQLAKQKEEESAMQKMCEELMVSMEEQKSHFAQEREDAVAAVRAECNEELAAKDAEIEALKKQLEESNGHVTTLTKTNTEIKAELDVSSGKISALLKERQETTAAFFEMCRMYKLLQSLNNAS